MKILIFGLPGSGKTTFAKKLIEGKKIPHFNADDINKYKMFKLDGVIKNSNIEENIFIKAIGPLMDLMPQIYDTKFQVLLFLTINNYTFGNGNIIANNIKYNDIVLDGPYHKIRTNEIKLNKYSIEDYLPSNIIKQYSNLDI